MRSWLSICGLLLLIFRRQEAIWSI
ncbi:MAG: hypothetical protein DCE86_05445 [Flavobacteriaceae bacterium]|nr:MAG: hypothetical protein DCE86_05445 [Flavobacteriaceae bacterium]